MVLKIPNTPAAIFDDVVDDALYALQADNWTMNAIV